MKLDTPLETPIASNSEESTEPKVIPVSCLEAVHVDKALDIDAEIDIDLEMEGIIASLLVEEENIKRNEINALINISETEKVDGFGLLDSLNSPDCIDYLLNLEEVYGKEGAFDDSVMSTNAFGELDQIVEVDELHRIL